MWYELVLHSTVVPVIFLVLVFTRYQIQPVSIILVGIVVLPFSRNCGHLGGFLLFLFFFKRTQARTQLHKDKQRRSPPGQSIGKYSRKNGFRRMRATITSMWVQTAIQSEDHWSRRYWICTYWSDRGGKPLLVFVPLCLIACARFEKKKKEKTPARGGHSSQKRVIL
jgi:hypothetical protein